MSYQRTDQDPIVDIVLEKSGRILRVEDYTIRSDFLTSTDSFSFTYYSEDDANLDGLEMQPVTIRVNGRPYVIGRIEKTTCGDNGSAVSCEGRDYIADLVECNVDPKLILQDGMTLMSAILALCAPCGITDIAAPGVRVDERTGKPGAGSVEMHRLTATEAYELKPKAGRGIYEVCEEILARFGLTLQPSNRRNLITIQPPSYDNPAIGRLSRTRGKALGNSITSGAASRDYSSFPTCALFTGKQGKPVETGGAKGVFRPWDIASVVGDMPAEMQRILAGAITAGRRDPDVLEAIPEGELYRLMYFKDDKIAKSNDHVENALRRAIADRVKETLRYRCKVRGHTDPTTGYTWCNDTKVEIDDDPARVHEELWCYSVELTGSKSSGPMSSLEFLRPWSYQVYAEAVKSATGGRGTQSNQLEGTTGWLAVPNSAQRG